MADPDETDIARELVRRIHAGDAAAERNLVVRYGPAVKLMLRGLSHSWTQIDDVHQETFVIVLQRLRRHPLDVPELLGSFVRSTARIVLMAGNRKRRLRERREVADAWLEDVADPRPGQLTRVLEEERDVLVRRLLARMRPARYRQLLSRFYLEGEAKEIICADLGLSSAHFNRVIHRARRRFLMALARELGNGAR